MKGFIMDMTMILGAVIVFLLVVIFVMVALFMRAKSVAKRKASVVKDPVMALEDLYNAPVREYDVQKQKVRI